MQMADGDVIAYLDDDDVYRPNHLEPHARTHAEAPEAGVVYADAERGTLAGAEDGGLELRRERVHSRDFDADALLVSNYIPILCMSHRRQCLEHTGLFDESLHYLKDWDLLIRLQCHWRFLHVPRITAI